MSDYTPPAAIVEAFAAIGWRITGVRPSGQRWSATVARNDSAATISFTGAEPEAVLGELLQVARAAGGAASIHNAVKVRT